MKTDKKTCSCGFCEVYKYFKWATVMECKCICHVSDGMGAHDSLCCALPNVLKKNNPYDTLEKSEVYQKRMNCYFEDEI